MNCKKCNKKIPQESKFCNFCGTSQFPKKRTKRNKMNGEGTVYKLPNGSWRAEYTLGYTIEQDGSKKRIYKTKTSKRKKDVLEALEKFKIEDTHNKDVTFHDLYIEWKKIKYPKLSAKRQTTLDKAYERIKILMPQKVAKVHIRQLQSIVSDIEHYYPQKDVKTLMNQLYDIAIKWEVVKDKVSQYVELVEHETEKIDSYNQSEIEKFWNDYNNGCEFVGYILIMIYTGLRPGELLALDKNKIFLDKKYMIGGLKTKKGIDREILIIDKISHIVEHFYNKPCKKFADYDYGEAFYREFYKTVERLKIRPLPPRACRHTFCTTLAKKNIHPSIIKECAGHESYETTLTYTHIGLDTKLAAAEKAFLDI